MMMMMMMPGSASACDTPQPKSKHVREPTESMKRRLAKHGDPRWPQEQCDHMTYRQLLEHFKELGLQRRQSVTVSMEDYSPDLSWEECLELKAADEKAAAAAPVLGRYTLRERTHLNNQSTLRKRRARP
eukprot:COSAG05_NODE_109_length_18675_cov_6.774279_16_plen_129_part_00